MAPNLLSSLHYSIICKGLLLSTESIVHHELNITHFHQKKNCMDEKNQTNKQRILRNNKRTRYDKFACLKLHTQMA